MSVSAKLVKELREKTGLGMMDCKKALNETKGDIDAAVDWLRKKGMAKSAKLASRIAAEGAVTAYVHGAGKIGVLLEVNCETDFTGRNDDFQELCRDIAMHIAAANPRFLNKEEVTDEILQKEREIAKAQVMAEGKPEHIADKIVEGRMGKFYSDVVLLEQPFVKDDKKTVEQMLTDAVARIGENIQIRRFTRFVLGEGLAKKEDDFAAEVAKTAGLS